MYIIISQSFQTQIILVIKVISDGEEAFIWFFVSSPYIYSFLFHYWSERFVMLHRCLYYILFGTWVIADNENIRNDNSGDNALQYWTIKNIEAQHVLLLLGMRGMREVWTSPAEAGDVSGVAANGAPGRLLIERERVRSFDNNATFAPILSSAQCHFNWWKHRAAPAFPCKLTPAGIVFFSPSSFWLGQLSSSFYLTDAVCSVPAPLSRCYHDWIPSSSWSLLQNFWQMLVFVSGNHTLNHTQLSDILDSWTQQDVEQFKLNRTKYTLDKTSKSSANVLNNHMCKAF